MTATFASIGSSFGGGGGGGAGVERVAAAPLLEPGPPVLSARQNLLHALKAPIATRVAAATMTVSNPKVIAVEPDGGVIAGSVRAGDGKAGVKMQQRLESIPGTLARPEIHGFIKSQIAASAPAVQHEASSSASSDDDDNNETGEDAEDNGDDDNNNLPKQQRRMPTAAPQAQSATMRTSIEDDLTNSTGGGHGDKNSLQFVGVATVDEVARARNAGGPIVPPSERNHLRASRGGGGSDLLISSNLQQQQQQRYVLVPEELLNSTLTPSSAPSSKELIRGGGSGSGGSKGNNDMSASHALVVSSPMSQSQQQNRSPPQRGGFVTPSGSFGSPPLATAAAATGTSGGSGTKPQMLLRHLDLVGDPRTLVNFLMHWINRECHWQSPGHARCVQQRLERIAAYAKREQTAYLGKLANDGAPPAELARYAALFNESQRTAQALLGSLDGNSNGKSGASLRRVQTVLLDFPYAIGPQYLARYLLAQPDWNEMADDYKNIIVQSDFEVVGDGNLTSPDRMIAQMSRSSTTTTTTGETGGSQY